MMHELLYLFFIALLTCCALPTNAQQEDFEHSDLAAENALYAEDLNDRTEQLEYYKRHPINLNHTSVEELKRFGLLSAQQISNLFLHIKTSGKLLNLLELQSITGFDLNIIEKILPYVSLSSGYHSSHLNWKEIVKNADQSILMRYGRTLQQQKGFISTSRGRYLGTPEKVLLKYRLQQGDRLSAGLLMEKDAGEQWLKNKLPDFISAHIAVGKLLFFDKAVIGDYSFQLGQGLTFSSGFSFGKGADVTSVAGNDSGIRPYTSANEANFLRGAATTMTVTRKMKLNLFFSRRDLDASLTKQSDGQNTLLSINESGLHRSTSELSNKNSVQQNVKGGALQYHADRFNSGLIFYHTRYNHPFIKGSADYKRYSFQGTELTNIGFHYNWTYKNSYFYGEAASSMDGGLAFLNGVLFSFGKKFSGVLLHRSYGKDYHSFFSRAVGENASNANEQGYYTGINYLFSKKWKFSFYLDYFRFPWLKYRVDAASQGFEILSQLNYQPRKDLKLSIRYKTGHKQQNPDDKNQDIHLQTVSRSNLNLSCQMPLTKQVKSQQRLELSFYRKNNSSENGLLLFQDLHYKAAAFPLSGNIRIAYFHTSSYNSRIYAYENDVQYSAASGSYFGEGFRHYINLRYRISSKMDVWARYSNTTYRHQDKIGSGMDEIQGNQKTEIKIQFRVQV